MRQFLKSVHQVIADNDITTIESLLNPVLKRFKLLPMLMPLSHLEEELVSEKGKTRFVAMEHQILMQYWIPNQFSLDIIQRQ